MKFKHLVVLFSVLIMLTACGNENNSSSQASNEEQPVYNNDHLELLDSDKHPEVTIEMSNGGIIKIELYPEIAPNTVSNFVSLVQSGFYDGLIFHRVIPDFMIQGGDPVGNGTGGPGYQIGGEFIANNFLNPMVHARGVISMARSQSMDSAGSQFFIMHADYPGLDGQYAAFGAVTEGMEVVDEIAMQKRDSQDMPKDPLFMNKVTVDLRDSEIDPLIKQ